MRIRLLLFLSMFPICSPALLAAEPPKQVAQITGYNGPQRTYFTFSSDNRLLAVPTSVKVVTLWDLNRKRPLPNHFPTAAFPRELAFTENNQALLVLTATSIAQWNLPKHKQQSWPMPHGSISAISLSPDSKKVAVLGKLNDFEKSMGVKIYEILTGKESLHITMETKDADDVAFSPKGDKLAVSTTSGVQLFDAKTGALLKTLLRSSPISTSSGSVVFHPEGHLLANARFGGCVIWNIDTGDACFQSSRGSSLCVFSPDGKLLAVGPKQSDTDDTRVELWSLPEGNKPQLLTNRLTHKSHIQTLSFAREGHLLATGGDDWTVKLWDLSSHELLAELKGHTKDVLRVEFSPNSYYLASFARYGDLRLWDTAPLVRSRKKPQ